LSSQTTKKTKDRHGCQEAGETGSITQTCPDLIACQGDTQAGLGFTQAKQEFA
jgi:hypothetical protein